MSENDQDDPLDAWLERLTYLSPRELSGLPGWQRPLAVVHQLVLIH
jgi:hypothetical protein